MAEKIPVTGVAPIAYQNVLQVVAVACDHCKQAATPNVAQFAESPEQVPMIAGAIHAHIVKATKALCVSPMLTISVMNVFVDTRLLERVAKDSQIVEP